MNHTTAARQPDFPPLPKRRLREQGRDPYDGLRFWSAATHGLGAGLAVLGAALLLALAALRGADPWKLVSFSVYGLSMVILYIASTLYHSVNTTVQGRVNLRRLDHTAIYFLIAGTYTPVCLTALRGPWGWALLGVIWALAVAGIFISRFWIHCPRALTAVIYIAMGWLAILALWPLWNAVGAAGLFWLLAGGVLYTAGGVLYALKLPGRNNPRFGCHEIFHVFILLGSLAHFTLMYRVILPY